MKYNRLIIIIHWAVVLLFVLLFLSDSLRSFSDKGSEARALWLNLHSWFGVAVFALTIARIIIKFNVKAPVPLYKNYLMQKLLSGTHIALYLVTLIVPISGYLRLAGRGRSLTIGGDAVPSLIGESDLLYKVGKMLHGDAMEVIILIIIGGHTAAALYHQFIKNDQVMSRVKL
nr:cytochrome b/b6 domain-containing protein [Providencia alcalifaciens]